MLQQGTRLSDTYIVVEQIGSGGGGIVYKAYHERLQTFVVAKQIKEKIKGILESRAEADILKNIKHTYLPLVYDFLEVEGEIYTVMDYVPGESLEKELNETVDVRHKYGDLVDGLWDGNMNWEFLRTDGSIDTWSVQFNSGIIAVIETTTDKDTGELKYHVSEKEKKD